MKDLVDSFEPLSQNQIKSKLAEGVKQVSDGHAHISKVQMKSLLQSEYTDEKMNKGFKDCCASIKPCSENIA